MISKVEIQFFKNIEAKVVIKIRPIKSKNGHILLAIVRFDHAEALLSDNLKRYIKNVSNWWRRSNKS